MCGALRSALDHEPNEAMWLRHLEDENNRL
jgi:hypothetical protein